MEVSERNLVSLRTVLGQEMLAGAAAGRAAEALLRRAVEGIATPWVLDFTGVKLITASAFREAVLSVVSVASSDGRPCLLANVNEVTRDEALIAASQNGSVLIFCHLKGLIISDAVAVGAMEAKLETTLRLVLELSEADAKAVSDASGEDTVTTAWNNRLVTLTRMGLLSERKVGKTKYYSAVIKGMSYGK